ncbi:universal stress protein [Roseateles koreensis]|uniref:Universal stress protein n=1 Tax=Roseateles koreensis TaxID=2987526 RepID=A0ABT5KSG0_9BURK|nr:universal stress protein [Roseateles koreensis]MDC8784806.1 universal stress protein [Roseateles koreensis]
MKILVAVDGSPYTKRMLAYLAAHDEWLGEVHEYTVIHVVPSVPPRAAAVLDREVLKSYYTDESEKVLKTLRAFFKRQHIAAEFVSKSGSAAEVIVAAANKGDFDLLMLGSHGHSALGNLVLGSVTTKVMANCKVPVLVVR